MIYGYTRVSTGAQDIVNQLDQFMGAKCERIFHEKVSGLTKERPQLQQLLNAAAKAAGKRPDRVPKITLDQIREAIHRREAGTETLATIGRSYNTSGSPISPPKVEVHL